MVAVADGLSSGAVAEVGAWAAVNAACQALIQSPDNQSFITITDLRDLAIRAVRQAHEAVVSLAAQMGINPAELASTLIVLVVSENDLTVAHIGDGIAIGLGEGGPLILSEPGPSEYANETACLVQHDWEEHMRVSELRGACGCILATDGCQGALAIRNGGNLIPYEPFILPLISFIDTKQRSGIDPVDDITSLLHSSRMQELSGDDKTLVILISGAKSDRR